MIAKDVNCAVRHRACLHCSPAKTPGDAENKERKEGTGGPASCFKRIPSSSWSVKSLAGELTRGIAEGPSGCSFQGTQAGDPEAPRVSHFACLAFLNWAFRWLMLSKELGCLDSGTKHP